MACAFLHNWSDLVGSVSALTNDVLLSCMFYEEAGHSNQHLIGQKYV